ncbi:MAG: hypothetical protein R2815_08375 [Flavobacteriales bacterium]
MGDTHNTVQKLFQGIMVIEQAEKMKVFDRDDIKKSRLYFSHLYTALQYEGFRNFLDIAEASFEKTEPVPKAKKEDLGLLLLWLYGSKKQDKEPVITSQNPDLAQLERVVRYPPALASLKRGATLATAYEESLPKGEVFTDSLYESRRHLQKAWGYVTEGYDRSESVLKAAGSLANLADELYHKMEAMHNENKPKGGKRKSE